MSWQLDTTYQDEQADERAREWRREWQDRHDAFIADIVAQVEDEAERMFREDFGQSCPSMYELADDIVDGYRQMARHNLFGGAA